MMLALLAGLAFALAALPAALAGWNLAAMRRPPYRPPPAGTRVSILVPARNEERNIRAAVTAALASRDVEIEVVVMDDGSTDRTAELVRAIAAEEPRLHLYAAPALPEGWTGKVHACHGLSEVATGTHLLFIDADVRLAPHAAAALASYAEETGAALVSGVPRQELRSLGELLTVPAINLLMVGYLPVALMRRSPDPRFGAACGQLMMVRAVDYRGAGGHSAIRAHIHDGLQLARLLRRRGLMTDVVAASDLATCRMYDGLREAWSGFSKNAREGMATPRGLPVWTVLLVGGHVLPVLLLPAALAGAAPAPLVSAALLLSFGLRSVLTLAARESFWTVPLHPLSVLTALSIQWSALLRGRRRPAGWKGRLYPAS